MIANALHSIKVSLDAGNYEATTNNLLLLKQLKYTEEDQLIKLFTKQSLTRVSKKQHNYITTKEIYDRVKVLPSCRFNTTKQVIQYESDVLTINTAMYKDQFDNMGKSALWDKYQVDDRAYDQDLLKKLSTYMLRDGGATEQYWYLFVGIEMLYGWNYDVVKTSSLEKLENWVQNDFKPTYDGDSVKYLQKFRLAVRKVLEWKEGMLEATMTVEEFALQIPIQGTSGAAYDPGGPRLQFDVHGVQIPAANNKFSKSAVLSQEQKIDRIKSYIKGKARVTNKVEHTPKQRLIISADYNSTEKMRYIDTWLQRWLHANPNSTLWLDKQQTRDLWLRFAKVGDEWAIPIDQSAFDHHVSLEMVVVMLEEIRSLIEKRAFGAGKSDLVEVMSTIIFMIYDTTVDYEDPITKRLHNLKYMSGILSGWQWTALLDTLANIAEKEVALEWLQDKQARVKMNFFNAQGDDQETRFSKLLDGLLYWGSLSTSGFEIHPTKNFFSKRHDEYLRRYSTKEGVNGYPARLINRMMWQYPGQQNTHIMREKITTICARWSKLCDRLRLERKRIVKYLIADARGAKLDKEMFNIIAFGTTLYGNLNFLKLNEESITEQRHIDSIPGTWKYHTKIVGAGYDKFKSKYGEDQMRELDDWIKQVCGLEDRNKSLGELKTQDTPIINENTQEDDISFVIKETGPIVKPKLNSGWYIYDIFAQNDTIMKRAFTNVELFTSLSNAPKSWTYDFILGKVTVPLPTMQGISEEGVSLLSVDYQNSIYKAMIRKKRKEDKWMRLCKYWLKAFPDVVKKEYDLPSMFIL